MKTRLAVFLFALTLAWHCTASMAATIFTDGFEGAINPSWSIARSYQGRVSIRSDYNPATGLSHLVLDDSESDTVYSAAEAILTLDLSNKKNVVLSFKAKSLGNEPHTPPVGTFTTTRNYDGVAISIDGGTVWRTVQSLATVGTSWETFSVTLDASVGALSGIFGQNFRIRFSEYDNAPAPLDGIAIDDVSVTADEDQRVGLELPASLLEGSGPHIGYVLLAFAPATPLTVDFLSSPLGPVIPTSSPVVVPAGQTYASFEFSVANDALVNLNRVVTVNPIAPPGVMVLPTTVLILDDEAAPIPTLTLPAQLAEGTLPANNAVISLNIAAAVPLTFSLSASPASELAIPATVTVPAGQTQVSFTAQAFNDTKLDGNIVVAVTAVTPGLVPAAAQTTTLDNEIPTLVLTIPAALTEGSTATGTVAISAPLSTLLSVSLSNSSSASLTVPATVAIPAGQTSATFSLTAVNDTFVNFTRSVTVGASATGVNPASATLSVLDDEALPVATLTLPAQLLEGASPSGNAILSLNVVPAVAVTFSLLSSPAGEVSIPSSVTVSAGQSQVTFTIQATNDFRIDGNIPVTVTATTVATSIAPVSAQTLTVDNETRVFTLTMPATIQEGGTGNGSISIPGSLTTALEVTLTNSNISSLIVPSSVTIPAGNTQATFSVTAVDNTLRDGSRSVSLSATAATFTSASSTVLVRDNDVAAYRFGTLTDVVNANSPLTMTVSAVDIEGITIAGFTGTVNLSVVLPGGGTQPLTPATALITGTTGWAGSVTLPPVASGPLRLQASDANGITGETASFDLLRTLSLATADLLWDPTRNRILASVPATSASYASQVVAIDPVTQQVTGSVSTGQDPGQLILTGGGEYLYVALNGNGTIAKINPATMSVLSTFAVGTSPSYGTLYPADMCAVAGQPNLLVVSQYRKSVSPEHNGVAVYDNGIVRPLKTQDHTGSNVIEPSADPNIFFGYCTESSEFGFRRLQLGANGMTQLDVNTTLIGGYYVNIRSDGNKVYSDSGIAVDGPLLKRLGTFSTNGLVRPDSVAGRVYFLEQQSTYSDYYDKIGAYDPATFSLIRRLTLPTGFSKPGSFIRWGKNGLAFRASTSVVFVESNQLVPSDAPTDLVVTVQATPNPAVTGAPLTYTIQATNQGLNVARNTRVAATLSDSQTIQNVAASTGVSEISGRVVSLPAGDLAAGATVTLSISVLPQSAGSLTCSASANSNAVESNFANNVGFKLVSVGFQPAIDVVNQLRLTANSLIYDPTRRRLWATIPNTVEAPLGRSVVSINPDTGLISDPIALGASPMPGSIALSADGRYLYVGLSDVAEVSRLDLSSTPPAILRVPLGLNGWSDAGYAVDIEVLDGDGTSVLVTTSGDESALVLDGTVRRANRTGIYTVNRVERTATPGIFVGYDNAISSYPLTRLLISSSGVAITQTVSSVVSGFSTDICGSGDLLLSSGGQLIDSSTLTLKAVLGVAGRPCVDGRYQRAYLINGNALRGFDTATGNPTGNLPLPTSESGDWARTCVRWGLDGFAILGNDGKIYMARWSATIPASFDQNNDGIADAWSVSNFGSLTSNSLADTDGDEIPDTLEYLFGTSPLQATVNPLRAVSADTVGDQTILHVTFPRRVGIAPGSYGYEANYRLSEWYPVLNVVETVLSTQTIDGVKIETINAAVSYPSLERGFVRLKWIRP